MAAGATLRLHHLEAIDRLRHAVGGRRAVGRGTAALGLLEPWKPVQFITKATGKRGRGQMQHVGGKTKS